MGVFDKMMSDSYKQAFIEKKKAQIGTDLSGCTHLFFCKKKSFHKAAQSIQLQRHG